MDGSGLVRQLKELAELRATGAISDEEFAAAKAAVLNGRGPGGADPGADPGPVLSSRPGASGGPAWIGGGGSAPGTAAGRFTPGDTASNPHPFREGGPSPVSTGRFAGHGGALTASAGGVLTLLAFVAMPLATVPFFGSITGANAAGFSSQFGVLGLLWAVPVLAAGAVGTAGWQIFGARRGQRRAGSITIIVLAALVVLDYVVVLGAVQAEASRVGGSVASFFGAGFWFAVLGMVAAGLGAVLEMAASRPTLPPAPAGR